MFIDHDNSHTLRPNTVIVLNANIKQHMHILTKTVYNAYKLHNLNDLNKIYVSGAKKLKLSTHITRFSDQNIIHDRTSVG